MLVIAILGKYLWIILESINFYKNGVVPDNLIVSNVADQTAVNTILLSNLLMTNIPDLLFLALGISLIVNGNKCVSKVISLVSVLFVLPIAINGLVGDAQYNDYIQTLQPWKYLLIGNGIQRMPFITNLLLIFAATGVFVSGKQFSRWSIISSLFLLSFILVYLRMCAGFGNLEFNCSGFAVYDWGVIRSVTGATVCQGIFYPLNTITNNLLLNLASEKLGIITSTFALLLFLMCIVLFVCKNMFTRCKIKIVTIYQPWYGNSKLFADVFYRIDAAINTWLAKFSKRDYLYGMNRSRFFSTHYNRFLNTDEPIVNGANLKANDRKNKLSRKKKNAEQETKEIAAEEELIANHELGVENNNVNNNLAIQTNDQPIQGNVVNEPYFENGKWFFENSLGEKYVGNDSGGWDRIN